MKTLRRNAVSSACTNVCKEECDFLFAIVQKLVELADFVRPKNVTSAVIYQQKATAELKVTPEGFAKFLFRQMFPNECLPDDIVTLLYRVGFIKQLPEGYVLQEPVYEDTTKVTVPTNP
jgi:hypothetical protein